MISQPEDNAYDRQNRNMPSSAQYAGDAHSIQKHSNATYTNTHDKKQKQAAGGFPLIEPDNNHNSIRQNDALTRD